MTPPQDDRRALEDRLAQELDKSPEEISKALDNLIERGLIKEGDQHGS